MPRNRTPKAGTDFYIEKELYLTTLHYCRQYPAWVAELSVEPDTSRAITYDREKVQSSNNYDATSEIAIRRHMIREKVERIDKTAAEVAGNNAQWIIMGTCYGLTFYDLSERGCLLPRNAYYKMRRIFYYRIAQTL